MTLNKIYIIILGNIKVFLTKFSIKSLKRLSICNKCNNVKKFGHISVCGTCGCVIKAKVTIKSEKCPLEKW